MSRPALFSWFVVGALSAGCASSATTRREDGAKTEQLPDEQAYRDAAEKFLEVLAEQQQAGPNVIHASGKDGIFPMYECMEYGCPDRVLCKKANVYCHVTHCGKGSCHGCPEPFPDVLKNLAIKQWCKFECMRRAVRLGPVLGFVPSIGNIFIGPFGCPDE